MNNKFRHLARISGLATTIVGMLYLTASQATAMRLPPEPVGPSSVHDASGSQSVLRVTDNTVSVLQWVVFAVVVIAALLIGAAVANLAQRHSTPQLTR